MSVATTIGFAVLEQTTITDGQGNVTGQTTSYRPATATEIAQLLTAAQQGKPSVSATASPGLGAGANPAAG